MRSPRRQRTIAPRSRRALEIARIDVSKEDTMVPGITDTECRLKQLRYRELHAEAERQRLASAACARNDDRGGVTETVQRRIGALMEQARHLLQGVRMQETTEHVAAPGTLAVSK
jgi:hypothetical protein